MQIKDIQIGHISLPLRHPFKTALRTVNSVEDIVVKIIGDDGQVGYGEAPPTAVITGETKGSIECAILNFIKPAIIGMEITELDNIMKKMHSCMVKNTSAKSAVDMAIYDLYGKALKAPVYKLIGGARKTINTDITISVNPIEQMVLDSIEAKNRGYDILKVKVGKDGLKDVESIKAIREAVGDDIVIRVDANQGWTAKQSVAIISAMEDAGLNIELVEQPVTAHDLDGMRYITKNVQTKILADESVFSAEDAIHIIQTKSADLINIKLMKTGGIYKALEICAVANIYNVECMIGCMLESRLSVSAGVHLGAGQSIVTLADLDGPSLCSVDPFTGGPIFNENIITMSDDFGIGVNNIPCDKWF